MEVFCERTGIFLLLDLLHISNAPKYLKLAILSDQKDIVQWTGITMYLYVKTIIHNIFTNQCLIVCAETQNPKCVLIFPGVANLDTKPI